MFVYGGYFILDFKMAEFVLDEFLIFNNHIFDSSVIDLLTQLLNLKSIKLIGKIIFLFFHPISEIIA